MPEPVRVSIKQFNKTVYQHNKSFNLKDIHFELPFLVLAKTLEAICSKQSKVTKNFEEKKQILRGYIQAFNDAKSKFVSKHGSQAVSCFKNQN